VILAFKVQVPFGSTAVTVDVSAPNTHPSPVIEILIFPSLPPIEAVTLRDADSPYVSVDLLEVISTVRTNVVTVTTPDTYVNV
jgi:hypothetical protein